VRLVWAWRNPSRRILASSTAGTAGNFEPENKMFRSEEHTMIHNLRARVGDKVRRIPSHGCATCNLHRRLFVHRGGIVEDVWPIEGSGCLE